jgi:hypothetical protein
MPCVGEQFRLAGSLWACVLEIRGPKLDSSSLQLILIDIVRRFGMSRRKMGQLNGPQLFFYGRRQ